jgi:hypothetical protein
MYTILLDSSINIKIRNSVSRKTMTQTQVLKDTLVDFADRKVAGAVAISPYIAKLRPTLQDSSDRQIV